MSIIESVTIVRIPYYFPLLFFAQSKKYGNILNFSRNFRGNLQARLLCLMVSWIEVCIVDCTTNLFLFLHPLQHICVLNLK